MSRSRPRFSTLFALGVAGVAALLLVAAVLLGRDAEPAGRTVVTVRLWDQQVAAAYRQSFDAFTAANPDVEVRVDVVAYSTYFDTLRTDVAGDSADDIFWISNAYFSAYADSGAFQMYAGTQPEHRDEVIGLLRAELEKLVNDGVSDDELDVAVGYLTGAFELGLEDTGARMARNGGQLVTTGNVRPIDEQVARWAAVDQVAVKRTIDRVLTTDPIIVTVGPAR